MHRILSKLPRFIREVLSEESATQPGGLIGSSKRFGFLGTIALGWAMLAFDVIKHGGLRSESISTFGILTGVTGAAIGITAFAK